MHDGLARLTDCLADLRRQFRRAYPCRDEPCLTHDAHSIPSGLAATDPVVVLARRCWFASRLIVHQAHESGVAERVEWTHGLMDLVETIVAAPEPARLSAQPVVACALRLLEACLADCDRIPDSCGVPSPALVDHLLAECGRVAVGLGEEPTAETDPAPRAPREVVIVGSRNAMARSVEPGRQRPGRARVLLIVAGAMRRHELSDRLVNGGFAVEVAADPESGWRRLESSQSFVAVLCDNVLPSLNLQRFRGFLEQSEPTDRPRLVLVAGGDPRTALRRARKLGAAGAWARPFAVQEAFRLIND